MLFKLNLLGLTVLVKDFFNRFTDLSANPVEVEVIFIHSKRLFNVLCDDF